MARGRIAKVKISDEQLSTLQAGGTVKVRLPKDVALLQISLVNGDPFAQVWSAFDKVWKEFDEVFKRFRFHK
jgi:hypothetical protein